jgi:hypothetical protein
MHKQLGSPDMKPRAVGAAGGAATGGRFLSDVLGLLILLVSLGGCGPALSKDDLGTVGFEIPKVAGADEPYQMPQLGPPTEQREEHDGPPDAHTSGLSS